jgi:phosphoserine phosphatase RsbU/P
MSGPLRLLVVDDDDVDRQAVRRALRGVSCEIDEETSAKSVVERLGLERYDCVILDHGLPGEDGLSLLQRIREAGITTPVLVVTGQEDGVAASLMAAGASDYLPKTEVSSHQLERRLRFAIRVGQAEERAIVAAHQLAAERRLLASVIDQLPAAVFIADVRGKLIFSNELARAYCGNLDTADGLGTCKACWNDGRFLEPLEWPLIRALREDCMISGVEMEIYQPEGGRVFVRATAAPVRSPTGELIAAVMILDDWTEERRAKQEMLRAVRVREDVLAVVSHDLRNPIHAVGVAIDELADPTLGEGERARYVGAVRRTLKRADRLIQDLLDASRIEAGALPVSPQPTMLRGILEQAAREHEVLAGEAGVKIIITPVDDKVQADRDRVLQALGNLIGNALRHARGTATLELTAERRDDVVWVSVADRGPGIDPEALPRIFDRFFQADRQRRAGTGLGLTIAEGIVRAHGGTIEARNRDGGGAEFRFSLLVGA